MSSFGLVEGPASVAVGGLMHTGVAAIKRHAGCFDDQEAVAGSADGKLPTLAAQTQAKALIPNTQVGIFSSNIQSKLIK